MNLKNAASTAFNYLHRRFRLLILNLEKVAPIRLEKITDQINHVDQRGSSISKVISIHDCVKIILAQFSANNSTFAFIQPIIYFPFVIKPTAQTLNQALPPKPNFQSSTQQPLPTSPESNLEFPQTRKIPCRCALSLLVPDF